MCFQDLESALRSSTKKKIATRMSEKTETGQIFGAAGDPCIAEIAKPSDAELSATIARAEVPEITLISEAALSSKVTPSGSDKVSHAAALGEGDVAIETV